MMFGWLFSQLQSDIVYICLGVIIRKTVHELSLAGSLSLKHKNINKQRKKITCTHYKEKERMEFQQANHTKWIQFKVPVVLSGHVIGICLYQ